MSPATNGGAQPSKACEMGYPSMVGVAPNGPLWYKSAAPASQTESPVHKLSDTGTPRMSPPPGAWSAATDQLTEREVNCVV